MTKPVVSVERHPGRLYQAPGLLPVVLVLAVLAGRFADRPPADTTWLLYVADRVLAGDRYGQDVFETSPPMVLLLKVPVVAIAKGLAIDPLWPWYITIASLACGCLLWTVALLRGARTALIASLPATLTCLTWAGLVVPGGDLGQRDHLTGLLVMPWVAVAVRRMTGPPIPAGEAILSGAVAALGIGMKPHFVLLPLFVTGFEMRALGVHVLKFPEQLATAALLLAYLGMVQLAAPDYYEFASRFGALYQDYLPFWRAKFLSWQALPAFAVVTSWAWLRRLIPHPRREAGDVMATAALSLLVAGFAQGKGWGYHFIPATLVAALLLATMPWAECSPRGTQRGRRVACILALAAAISLFAGGAARVSEPAWRARTIAAQKANDQQVRQAVRLHSRPGEAIGVLSTAIESSFPLLHNSGRLWAFRLPFMWPLVSLHKEELFGDRPISRPSGPARAAIEQYLVEVCEDLTIAKPRVLLVVIPRPPEGTVGVAQRFDYLAYLSAFPPVEAALAHYQDHGIVGGYRLLVREATGTFPGIDSCHTEENPGDRRL